MMENIWTIFAERVAALDYASLAPGLLGGAGVATLSLLDYQIRDCSDLESHHNRAVEYLQNQLTAKDSNAAFLHGGLSVPWSLKRLANLGIISEPPMLADYAAEAMWRYSAYYSDIPFQFNPFDEIWPIGALTSEFLNPLETSIAGLSWQETAIHRIRDCEKLLCSTPIPGLYSPTELRAGVLHSLLSYLRKCHRLCVFPYKCTELLPIFDSLNYNREESSASDVLIYESMLGHKHAVADLKTAARCGLFSFIYEDPSIFAEAIENIDLATVADMCATLPVDEFIGLAFGFYTQTSILRTP